MTTYFGMRSFFPIEAFVVAFVVLINEAEPFLSPAAGGVPLVSAKHQNCNEDCTRSSSARTNAPKVFTDIQRMGEQAHRQTGLTLVESTVFRRGCASRNNGGSDAGAAGPTRWLLDDGDHGGRGGGRRGGRDDHGGGEGDGDAWDKEGPRPLLLATGLMSGLNELWDALRNFCFPGNHQVTISRMYTQLYSFVMFFTVQIRKPHIIWARTAARFESSYSSMYVDDVCSRAP